MLGDINSQAIDINWSAAAESYAKYKVCLKILDGHQHYSVERLQLYLIDMVADLIATCVKESPKLLVERSRKWAAELREDKIFEAMKLVGFACGVMDGVNAASPSTFIDYGLLFPSA
ncbi:hypothetical protein SUGI_0091370 [Cryptomeria japonica]|nr:hypothetical protein SUGI_0091370 [Cryptomeria japonica]